jgi:hypothetical protein
MGCGTGYRWFSEFAELAEGFRILKEKKKKKTNNSDNKQERDDVGTEQVEKKQKARPGGDRAASNDKHIVGLLGFAID